MKWTTDGFLDGRLQIHQPEVGFRAGSDAVLLAAAIEGKSENLSVLDVGCGVGTAGLCLKHRLSICDLIGLDLQEDLVSAALENAAHNNLSDNCAFYALNITDRGAFKAIAAPDGRHFLEFGFDHVITNPPFYEEGRAQASPSDIKAKAHLEGDADLSTWLQFCIARLKPKGMLSLIHRTDRLDDILAALSAGKCGRVRILPLWPNLESPAKRVIVQAVKGDKSPLKLMPGLVLHEMSGIPTEKAEKILREGVSIGNMFK